MPEIEKLSKEEQRANYLLTKQDDVRITGLFPEQQKKVRDDIFKRRKKRLCRLNNMGKSSNDISLPAR